MPHLNWFKFNCICTHRVLSALLTALLITVFTQNVRAETETSAITAAAADTASTAVGLAKGLVELNPLGLVGSLAVKVATIAYIDKLPEEDRAQPFGFVSAFWGGAAANNLCWLTGAGPLCFVLGIATGSYLWNSGQEDRTYWASCKSLRSDHPEAPCSRSDKNIHLYPEPVLALAR